MPDLMPDQHADVIITSVFVGIITWLVLGLLSAPNAARIAHRQCQSTERRRASHLSPSSPSDIDARRGEGWATTWFCLAVIGGPLSLLPWLAATRVQTVVPALAEARSEEQQARIAQLEQKIAEAHVKLGIDG